MQREIEYSFRVQDVKNAMLYELLAISWTYRDKFGGDVQADVVFPVQDEGLV